MLKKSTSWAVFIYGILITILGYLGYSLAASKMSLYAGCGLGILLVLSSFLMFYQIRFGGYASLFLTLILLVTFAIRYSVTHNGLPATLAVVSGGMFLYLLLVQKNSWNQ